MRISIPVSVGELFDRISILRIKSERISDPEKLVNVREELEQLESIVERDLRATSESEELERRLTEVNTSLWEVEDEIRELEAASDFGAAFVRAARSVYRLNDERHALKRALSVVYGSEIVAEKSYAGS